MIMVMDLLKHAGFRDIVPVMIFMLRRLPAIK